MEIIGLSGTNGSGKDFVGELLAREYNFMFISVTDLLRAEATLRREPVEREVLRSISAEWRRESGLGVLVEKAHQEYLKVADKYDGVVIGSMRNPGEADAIHELGGVMVWLDADARIRYDRIQVNVVARNRAEEDNKTFEQFIAEEEAEMHLPEGGDIAQLDGQAVKDRCDVFIVNDGSDADSIRAAVAELLS